MLLRPLLRSLVPAVSLALGFLIVGLPVGCGSAASSAPTTAHGVVQFLGYPLSGGMIVFAPDVHRGTAGKPIRADIAANGTFELKVDGSPNIPPGWYRIAIAEPSAAAGSYLYAPQTLFPVRLRRPDKSDLVRQVQAGKDNVFEFLIEANAVKVP